MELGLFEEFGELHPVADLIEPPGLVVRMAPQTRGLVAAAYKEESTSANSSVCMQEHPPVHSHQDCYLHISTKALSTRLFLRGSAEDVMADMG